MEKLELKHIQAYNLGENGVNVLLTDYAKLELAIENVDLSERFYISNVDFESETIFIIAESGYEIDSIPLGYIKPILRPLSDIVNEIEHKGEKFVPLHKLLELSNFDLSKMDNDEILSYKNQFSDLYFLNYTDAQQLFEWHFDIFNLIESNLAIDINTI